MNLCTELKQLVFKAEPSLVNASQIESAFCVQDIVLEGIPSVLRIHDNH